MRSIGIILFLGMGPLGALRREQRNDPSCPNCRLERSLLGTRLPGHTADPVKREPPALVNPLVNSEPVSVNLKQTQLFSADSVFNSSGGSQKGCFPKEWFWRMCPRNENRNEGTFACFPRNENWHEGTFACFPGNENRNEGAFAKNHPFANPPFCLPVNSMNLCKL